ncbi:MAG: hypothetical protein COB51_06930 [Moraxellaceae bacterium]|nr:MAG: hypothetical protein COB51_06930 [Moraxellaceae bacterium]
MTKTIVDNLFICNPDCSIFDLTFLDWGAVLSFLISIYVLTTVLRRWAFEWNNYPETSFKWHIPRFIFIAFIFAMVTLPLIWRVFGYLGAQIYGQFIYPEAVFIVYIAWLSSTEKRGFSLKKGGNKAR